MIIAQTKDKWRCVFADRSYKKGDTIEICEYVTIPQAQIEILKKTVINDYWFWKDGDRADAIFLLWNGSLYNHSNTPNMDAIMEESGRMWFAANRDIEDGEELVFDYWYIPKFQVQGHYKIVTKKLWQTTNAQ